MLRQIDKNLWVTEQPLKFMGLEVGTRMTVVRLRDNSLQLISPVKITPEIEEQLNSLGEVKRLIAPNLFHYLYLTATHKRYPQAQIIAPPGLDRKQPTLKIDKILTQDKIDFDFELEYCLLEGFQALIFTKIMTVNEIVFYHAASKTLIITDSAFNFDASFPPLTKFAARILGSYQVLKPSWLEKLATQDKDKLKNSMDKILGWDFQRVVMGHGKIVEHEAKEKLLAGYQWLIK